MMGDYCIRITDEMRELADTAGRARFGNKEPYQEMLYGDHPSVDTNIFGALGEIIVASALGLEFDAEARKHGDDGWDMAIVPNLTIDVKARRHKMTYSTYDLALDEPDPFDMKADIYVLVIIDGDIAHLYGWTSKVAMMFHGQRIYYRDWRWAMPSGKLRHFDELVAQSIALRQRAKEK